MPASQPPAHQSLTLHRVLLVLASGVALWAAVCAILPGAGWLAFWIGSGLLALAAIIWQGRSFQGHRLAGPASPRPAEEALDEFFDFLPVGAAVIDLEGHALRCNRKGLELLGITLDRFRAIDWKAPDIPLLQLDGNPLEREQMPVNVALATCERATGTLGIERLADGDWAWVSIAVDPRLDARGQLRDLVCTFEDVTQRKTTEAELAIQTFRDRLTSLPNRVLFMERLTQAILRSDRRRLNTGVLFLDLDRFKVINDSLSHEAGDQLLVQVARRIRASLRPEDTVARLGGDEFVVLFEDLPTASDAMRVAERIKLAFETAFLLQGQEAYTTCSMGLALSASSSTVPSELVRDSEVAMYRAKAKREGSIEIFDPSMNAQALARFQMESELRRALERGEFLLYYQPLVSLRTGCIEGWEALVRWKHPERGMIPPLDFISLAEETGLIVPLGKWVLEEAVRQASLWATRFPADPPHLISVNISGRQFQQRDLIGTVLSALNENGFDPRCLKLEITESVMMRDPQASLEAMKVFRSHQIHLVIDDFGTGYSSLSYLKRFPVDTLKVDKSFVDGLGKDPESTAIVQAVISLAKSLGMRVTAEGIETREQLEHLRSLDCDQGQGYFLARPLSAVAAEELLMKNPRW
jgi:diguanylate cyclase (GGDEF)-like protein/PAS domain S-box-containing protein